MQPSLYVSGVGYAVGTCIRRAVKDFRKMLLKRNSKNDEIDAMVVGLMLTFFGIVNSSVRSFTKIFVESF